MNPYDVIAWLEAKAEITKKQGSRIAAKTLAETAAELRLEIELRNAANIAALLRPQKKRAELKSMRLKGGLHRRLVDDGLWAAFFLN